ncbi:phenazine biosynthesis protein PhzF [Arcobacter sp. CECT 8983]|uniref:PhzF family phenazine biosynthesis protein n=1 Tax=Arcobacter sp. CECT 8983 TaxID=2044508 RepID=UPI00100B6EA1|nr:PhzF family phenazine biosynthesis protein [Arcobacter sp. CECT 8983]RXJ88357.1 phenazine biosynthesis protein PhzF [Arcobacter sp. CECT 8983]
MNLKIYQVDAFTNKTFKGNSAAVIILEEWLEEELMQEIAIENNLSETAFAKRCEDSSYEIRWFSPITEIDFCGHATLATAFILFNKYDFKKVTFKAAAVGNMDVTQLDDGYIKMVFPNRKPILVSDIPNELINGLSIKPKEVFVNQQAYFAVYEKEDDIYNIEVNLEEIKKLAPLDVTITAKAEKYDFITRYFWPANGGIEDPVTGSMHTGAAPLWAEKLNKNELIAYQASKRGGDLKCIVDDKNVTILGEAVLYLEGNITI